MAVPTNTNFALGSRTIDPDTNKVYKLTGRKDSKNWTLDNTVDSRSVKNSINWYRTFNSAAELDTAKSGSLPVNATSKYPRYPYAADTFAEGKINYNTDYVLFQFMEYSPPFKNSGDGGNILGDYNQSINDLEAVEIQLRSGGVAGVILPMPQDLSTEQKQNWNGKKFTRLGATAIRAAGGDFSKLGDNLDDGGLKSALDALKTSALNRIPGVGGNLSINDIAGSTRGVVLNPNAELLYDSPDLREIGMVFKMVPQSETEAKQIKMICDTFRTASLPEYGSKPGKVVRFEADSKSVALGSSNWIRVPNLCKFTFMTGSDSNTNIAQYKPCAITGVQVNYTPDGTYATYGDGSPVATEITLKFVETKLIFSSEIQAGF